MMNKNDNATLESLLKRVEHLEKNGVPGLLDFFASSALSELSHHHRLLGEPPAVKAQRAYKLAQAMIEERKKYVR